MSRSVVYSARALEDFERIIEFAATSEHAKTVVALITSAVQMLADHPFVGRPLRGPIRELVISQGRTGYVALYRVGAERVEVLAVRHQREAGYR